MFSRTIMSFELEILVVRVHNTILSDSNTFGC